MGTELSPPERDTAPNFWPLLWSNGWMDQDATWYGGRPRRRRHCVRWRPSPPKGAQQPPILGPCLWWSKGWMDQDATWYRGRPQPRQRCVTWGPSSHHGNGHSGPQTFRRLSKFFSAGVVAFVLWLTTYNLPSCACCTDVGRLAAHVYCGEMVAHLS